MLTPKTNNFTHDEWNKLLHLCNISHFSSASCPKMRQECNKEQEKRELWQSQSRRWTWSRVLRQALIHHWVRVHQVARGILRAPSQQGSNLKAPCAGKLAAGGSKNDAGVKFTSVANRCKVERTCEETRLRGHEPGSEFSRKCKETCRWKFGHQRRGRLEVAAQSPRISC